MAIDADAIRKLQNGADYMPGRPQEPQTEEERIMAIAAEAKTGAADRFYEKPKAGRSEKGSDDARAKMKRVRAAKGKERKNDKRRQKDKPESKENDELVGLLGDKED